MISIVQERLRKNGQVTDPRAPDSTRTTRVMADLGSLMKTWKAAHDSKCPYWCNSLDTSLA